MLEVDKQKPACINWNDVFTFSIIFDITEKCEKRESFVESERNIIVLNRKEEEVVFPMKVIFSISLIIFSIISLVNVGYCIGANN